MKKLTIITVCYNEENLEDTLKSIVEQTWQNFEWIVVDGGSKKEIQDIFEKYKYRIDKFISEPDTGIYDAMNKGIRLASGKYLNFLNAGDSYYYENALRDVYPYLASGEAGVLYGNANYESCCEYLNSISSYPREITKNYFCFLTLCHQASFIKRSLFEDFGLYDEQYKVASDYEKWIKFIANGVSFKYVPYIIANFKLGGISSSSVGRSVTKSETNKIKNKFFTSNEVYRIIENLDIRKRNKLSLLKIIFSIRNGVNRWYKVLTIFGKKYYLLKK